MHASYETDVCRLTHNMCPLVDGPPFARKMMFYFLFLSVKRTIVVNAWRI